MRTVDGVHDQLRGHPRIRVFASQVDVGDHHPVGGRQRPAHVSAIQTGAAHEMGLVGDDQSSAASDRPRRRQIGGDFGRVMSVRVIDPHPAGLAEQLHPALRPGIRSESLHQRREIMTQV